MFFALRRALLDAYSSVGDVRMFMTDFELAAVTTVKGCSFHFRQALMQRIQQEVCVQRKVSHPSGPSVVAADYGHDAAPCICYSSGMEQPENTTTQTNRRGYQNVCVCHIFRFLVDQWAVSAIDVVPLRPSGVRERQIRPKAIITGLTPASVCRICLCGRFWRVCREIGMKYSVEYYSFLQVARRNSVVLPLRTSMHASSR